MLRIVATRFYILFYHKSRGSYISFSVKVHNTRPELSFRLLPKWQELGGHEVYLIITGHDNRDGLKLVGDELTEIFAHLGNEIKDIIWGEKVWKKGEVNATPAMTIAYQAGLRL